MVAENRPATPGAIRKDVEAALALLVEEPGIGTQVKTARSDIVRSYTSPEFATSFTTMSADSFSMLSGSGMLVAKQGRRYDAEPIHQHGGAAR